MLILITGHHILFCINVTLQPGTTWQDIQAHLKDGVVLCKSVIFTLCLKTIHSTFDHNFGKRKPIFKILSLTDSR